MANEGRLRRVALDDKDFFTTLLTEARVIPKELQIYDVDPVSDPIHRPRLQDAIVESLSRGTAKNVLELMISGYYEEGVPADVIDRCEREFVTWVTKVMPLKMTMYKEVLVYDTYNTLSELGDETYARPDGKIVNISKEGNVTTITVEEPSRDADGIADGIGGLLLENPAEDITDRLRDL